MANYGTLQAAIDAGISNMTKIFGPTKYDSGYGTIQTGIDWFFFKGSVLSSIYIHGNSYLGFNNTSDTFHVNERDASVYEAYREEGIIGVKKFFRLRWVGQAYWNSSLNPSSGDYLAWELFFFDTGQIFLNYYEVPTSYFTNTNAFVADTTISFSVTSGVPYECTFTPSDPSAGTGWSLSSERPKTTPYKLSGNAIFTIQNYIPSGEECLYWDSNVPDGTSLKIFTKVNDGNYSEILQSGGSIVGLPSYSCTLCIKVELLTNDTYKTPQLNLLRLTSNADKKVLTLNIGAPNLRPAVGDVIISYDGLGGLQGQGVHSEAFDGEFIPDVDWYANPNDEEHIELEITASGTLTKIDYIDTQLIEHIELAISAVGVLTDIHNL